MYNYMKYHCCIIYAASFMISWWSQQLQAIYDEK